MIIGVSTSLKHKKGFNLLKSCLDFLDKKDADKLNEFIGKHQNKQQKKFGFKL